MDLNLEKKIERKLKKINSRKLILKETVKMYKNMKKQKLLIKRNIVNILSYDAFRLIFDYLDYETVYSIIRKVCKRLKMYVDSYIQPSEIFLSSAGREIPNQIHYYFDCPAKQKLLVRENLARPSVNQSSKPMKYMIENSEAFENNDKTYNALERSQAITAMMGFNLPLTLILILW